MVARPSIRDAFVLPGGVGYIAMTEGFNSTTASELAAALKQLHRLGAASLVIDLRDNPGGILEQAVKVAEKFLPAGSVIVTQKGRSRADNHVWRSTNRFPETMPLVLLVNENTASASEIFAGALQDHDRAYIVGQRTFGKGLVQSVYDTPYGSGLTLTTARYFTPSGRLIQRDYSSGAIYDYYNHRTDITRQTEARTSGNRPVFGGDGITPDDVVQAKELTPAEDSLLDSLFFFSRDVVYKREAADAMTPAAFAGDSASGVPINDKLVADFATSVRKSSPETADLSSENGFVTERLKYFLTLAARGEEAANRVLLVSDPQLQRAVAELPKARDLALASLSNKGRIIH
jgi:carboxyl-terminal processing protease